MITLQKILVPTDFSDLSQQALEFALSLADTFRAKLYVMHVWELPMTGSLLPPEPYPESVLTEEQTGRRGSFDEGDQRTEGFRLRC